MISSEYVCSSSTLLLILPDRDRCTTPSTEAYGLTQYRITRERFINRAEFSYPLYLHTVAAFLLLCRLKEASSAISTAQAISHHSQQEP